ncbi:hypothetical protein F4V47_06885 [Lactococcus garvieae subsp. garvieae]|nr:hypothetical protein F4V47_06885 [Lactococcus garvieae subsp. garvieae]
MYRSLPGISHFLRILRKKHLPETASAKKIEYSLLIQKDLIFMFTTLLASLDQFKSFIFSRISFSKEAVK